MTRNLTRLILSAAIVGAVFVVATELKAHATPPSGLTNLLLASGTNLSAGTIPFQEGTKVVMTKITVLPGGSSGWHSHPGGAIIVVGEGSLTVYGSVGSHCEITTYGAGQAFIERPGEVDQVVNTGTVPYVLYVTFPRVPQGLSSRTDEPNPGTCGV